MDKEFYYRNLPHIQPRDGIFFVTYRLINSLPKEIVDDLMQEEYGISKLDLNDKEKSHAQVRYFKKFDDFLDRADTGPTYLADPGIANIVVDSLRYLDDSQWSVICYCVMSNHVHIVVERLQKELFRIMQSHKRHTAREANKLLNRNGNFWQKESYDHLVRDHNELERCNRKITMY